MKTMLMAMASAALLLAAGCSGSDTGTDPTPVETTGATLRGVIRMPAGWTGSPKQIAITGYKSVPPLSSPDWPFSIRQFPEIHNDQPFPFVVEDVQVPADKNPLHVMVAIYLSGSTKPVAGEDFVGFTAQAFDITGSGEFDVGEIQMQPYPTAWPE